MTTQGPQPARAIARRGVAFPIRPQGRHPRLSFRSSIPGPLMPLSTLRKAPLAAHPARLEVKMDRYSFLVRLFHSLLHAGLSRRSDVRVSPPETGKAQLGRLFCWRLWLTMLPLNALLSA